MRIPTSFLLLALPLKSSLFDSHPLLVTGLESLVAVKTLAFSSL